MLSLVHLRIVGFLGLLWTCVCKRWSFCLNKNWNKICFGDWKKPFLCVFSLFFSIYGLRFLVVQSRFQFAVLLVCKCMHWSRHKNCTFCNVGGGKQCQSWHMVCPSVETNPERVTEKHYIGYCIHHAVTQNQLHYCPFNTYHNTPLWFIHLTQKVGSSWSNPLWLTKR